VQKHALCPSGRWLVAALLITVLVPAAALADGDGKPQVREKLLPVYQQLLLDPQHKALERGMIGRWDDPAAVERYLRALPMSPLELLELKMFSERFEIAVPKGIHDLHRQWVKLHETSARALYGDAYVERLLAPPPLELGPAMGGVPGKAATVGPNRNVAFNHVPPPLDYQGEIQLVVNPNNNDQIVAATNTFDNIGGTCGSFGMQAAFFSADGGQTWGYSCPPDAPAYGLACPGLGTFGSDPALHWDAGGNVYLEYMLLCALTPTDIRFSIVVSRSTDGGATWNPRGVLVNSFASGDVEDKEFYAIDNHPQSPFFGRHYTCWDRNNDEKSAFSTDAGRTWTEVDLPATPSTGPPGTLPFDLGCEMAVEDDGTVHVIYDTLRCPPIGNCRNEQMFYSRSTDGGASWSAPVLVRDFNLVSFSSNNFPDAQDQRGINPFGAIDVDNTGGPCDGNLYVTFTDFLSGGGNNADVFISRSTDGGASWSEPLRVNDDDLAGRAQFHPFLVVDQSAGDPVIGWHDARNDPGNDAVDFFLARSGTCGRSVEPNLQVSQPSNEFNNSAISSSNENSIANPGFNPNQYGEYLGLDAQNNQAWLAWTDTRHYFPAFGGNPQLENVGFAAVDFGYYLSGPKPGSSGANTTWTTHGATPGATNFFIFGFTAGSVAVPGCPGKTVGIADINILGSPAAGAGGQASTSLFVPAGASGLTVLFQAVELSTCQVSNLVTYKFP